MIIKSLFKRIIKHFYAKIKIEEDAAMLRQEKDELKEAIKNHFSNCQDNKKLLFFAHEIKALGASILLNNIALFFTDNGYKIVLVTNPGCEINNEMLNRLPSGVLVLKMHNDSEWNSFLLKEIASNGVEKCLANTVISGCYTKEFKELGFYVVTLIHEMAASIRILKAEKMVDGIAEFSDVIVFATEKAREQFQKIASVGIKGKSIILAQGIYNKAGVRVSDKKQEKRKLNELYGIPENSIVLIGIGAVNFGKGVDLLIPTLFELKKHNRGSRSEKAGLDYHVIWLGKIEDPSYYEWMRTEISNAGLDDYWHWLGFVQDQSLYYSIINAADIFTLPSREDTYPSVALEAASVALPIAAFENSGGGSDIAYKQNGHLAKPADVVDYSGLIEYLVLKHDEVFSSCLDYASIVREEHDFLNYCQRIENVLCKWDVAQTTL